MDPDLSYHIREFKITSGQDMFSYLSPAQIKENLNPLKLYAFYIANRRIHEEDPYFKLITQGISERV